MAGRRSSGRKSPVKNKEISCDFFRVRAGRTETQTLSDILEIIDRLPTAEDRNHTYDGEEDVYRLHGFERVGKEDCRGVFVRLKTSALAEKASLTRDEIEDVDLLPGEHILERFAFCYYHQPRILVMQRNREVGGHARFASYIRNVSKALSVVFDVVFNKDALNRISDMDIVTRAEITLAIPTTNSMFDTAGKAVSEVLDLGQKYNGAMMTIIITSAGTNRYLSPHGVHELATQAIDFLGKGKKNGKSGVTKAKVKGRHNELSPDIGVDLIEDRLSLKAVVGYTGQKPLKEDFYRAIDWAYNEHRAELIELYQNPQKHDDHH